MTPPVPPAHVQSLTPYQPGKTVEEIRELTGLDRIIKLASNENPLGSSPKAVAAMHDAVNDLSRYPRSGLALRQTLAARHGIGSDEVVVAAGSEGVLLAAMRGYLEAGDEVITAEGTFIGFYVIARAMNLTLTTAPLTADYVYDLDALLDAVTERTRLIYIANPNNPTGTAVRADAWQRFLDRLPAGVLVIMDEAYFEYASDLADDYPDSLTTRHPQVLTLRTFSKAYGLAAARIGYGIGHPDVITTLLKVKLPFEPSWVSEAAGIGALDDDAFLAESLRVNREGLQRLHQRLDERRVPHTASMANFTLIPFYEGSGGDGSGAVLASTGQTPNAAKAAAYSERLLQAGIIARPMVPFRLPHCVRISIGTPAEMDVLLDLLDGE